jgi:hypothetical protein
LPDNGCGASPEVLHRSVIVDSAPQADVTATVQPVLASLATR